jgi:Fic family protein/predicted XRE-type DNA-binding protein
MKTMAANPDNPATVLLKQMHDTLVLEVEDYLRVNGISRTQFAEKLGVSKSYLSQLLNAKGGDHKLSRLVSIALAIGKHPHFVLVEPPARSYRLPELQRIEVADIEDGYGTPQFARSLDFAGLQALPIMEEVQLLKQKVDECRPISEMKQAQILQKFRLAWNYNSNAIEGNELTYGETVSLILNGLTAKGKPLKDHLDVEGHHRAVEFMLDMIKGNRGLTQSDIRQLHKLLLKESYQQPSYGRDGEVVYRLIRVGEYKRQPNHVRKADGSTHAYAEPGEVPARIGDLLNWYDVVKNETAYHPLVIAAIFHHEFVAIHPFDDGNGRMGRILMNFILMQAGYPPAVIPIKLRKKYYRVLSEADIGNFESLVEYLGEVLLESLKIQFDGASGGKIEPYKWDG